jgi:hypothetical protein
VTRIGGTGHRLLVPETRRLVEAELRRHLAPSAGPRLVGVSSLADGADQVFAEVVLALGGSLEVVVPSAGYREALPPDCWPAYDRLLGLAGVVEDLGFPELSEEALMAAGRRLVERSDRLVAVWDGRPARGVGGTGDVVDHARRSGVPIHVVWPPGCSR